MLKRVLECTPAGIATGGDGRGEAPLTLNPARHFLLLTVLAASLGSAASWREPLGPAAAFGLYGALHAAAMVATLRVPRGRTRAVSFIVLAAGLSMLVVRLGTAARQWLGAWPAVSAPALLLTACAGAGAAAYALLVKWYWHRRLDTRAVVFIALICMSATRAAVPAGLFLHTAGGWWFAMIWWYAFSAAFCYQDRRRPPEVEDVRHP